MASQNLNRYIWILNTLIKHRELTFEEIAERWSESELCNGKPMALRTFHDHRKAILELFGVEIKCNTSNGYRYNVRQPFHKDTQNNKISPKPFYHGDFGDLYKPKIIRSQWFAYFLASRSCFLGQSFLASHSCFLGQSFLSAHSCFLGHASHLAPHLASWCLLPYWCFLP